MPERVALSAGVAERAVERVGESVSDEERSPVEGFEDAAARTWGVDHAVAATDPLAALAGALRAAGVDAGASVILPGFAPSGVVDAVRSVGAEPILIDVNPLSYTMDADHLSRAAERRPDASAVVPVHADGHPADMGLVARVARRHDLAVVEAAGGAAGAAYGGRPVGALGDVGWLRLGRSTPVGVPSEGALLLTDDEDAADRLRERTDGGLDDEDAAVAAEQLRTLPERTERRNEVAERYRDRLRSLTALRLPHECDDVRHAYRRFVVQTGDRDRLADHLASAGIETGVPHRAPSELSGGDGPAESDLPTLPRAERIADRVLALPVHADLEDGDVERVCDAVTDFFGE